MKMETGMEDMEERMEIITSVLPKEWREKARELVGNKRGISRDEPDGATGESDGASV